MDSRAEQLRMPLEVKAPYCAYYFIPHSGIAHALSALEHAIHEIEIQESAFRPFSLLAPAGMGKTHLVSMIRDTAAARGFGPEKCMFFDDPLNAADADADTIASAFIAAYERMKSSGGLLVFAARERPSNPHINSRLGFSVPLDLSLPQEDELRPLAVSLLERRNLRLSDANISYLLNRLPADPLSLSHIFAKIDELSLSEGRHAGRTVLREVLDQTESR